MLMSNLALYHVIVRNFTYAPIAKNNIFLSQISAFQTCVNALTFKRFSVSLIRSYFSKSLCPPLDRTGISYKTGPPLHSYTTLVEMDLVYSLVVFLTFFFSGVFVKRFCENFVILQIGSVLIFLKDSWM